MPNDVRELYRSANGDAWFLERDRDGRAYMLHEPNQPSGGSKSRVSADEFLQRSGSGPEREALKRALRDEGDLDEQVMEKVMRECPL